MTERSHGNETHRKLVPVPVRMLALSSRWPSAFCRISVKSACSICSHRNTVSNNALTEFFKVVPIPFAADELQYLRRITARNALRSLFERR